jgi:hypothetical protein
MLGGCNGMDFQIDPLNSISEAMNKGTAADTSFLEMAKQQCLMNIQQNYKAYAFYQQCQASLAPAPMQTSSFPMAAMMAMGPDTPKTSNIYTPKPLPTNKADISRMGRSHSMFVPSLNKSPPLEEEKLSSNVDKNSEAGTLNSDKKELSDNVNSRKRMNVFKCPHKDRKHYAKNMCNNCYHKQGRNKKATHCPHEERQNYAKGKCQNCYLNDYHKIKRKMKKQQLAKDAIKDDEEVDRRISVETSSTDHQAAKQTAVVVAEI